MHKLHNVSVKTGKILVNNIPMELEIYAGVRMKKLLTISSYLANR
jgi:hypothetical protein